MQEDLEVCRKLMLIGLIFLANIIGYQNITIRLEKDK